MALSYGAKRKLAVLILLIGLPIYIVVAVNLIDWSNGRFGRMPIWMEFVVFVVLGILWAIPCRKIFKGVGQADPDQK